MIKKTNNVNPPKRKVGKSKLKWSETTKKLIENIGKEMNEIQINATKRINGLTNHVNLIKGSLERQKHETKNQINHEQFTHHVRCQNKMKFIFIPRKHQNENRKHFNVCKTAVENQGKFMGSVKGAVQKSADVIKDFSMSYTIYKL